MSSVGLKRGAGGLEDLGIDGGVVEFCRSDLGERVARLHDVLLLACASHWHAEDGSGSQEVGPPVEYVLVEVDQFYIPGAVPEALVGDLPEAVAASDGVGLGPLVDGRCRGRCGSGRRADWGRLV